MTEVIKNVYFDEFYLTIIRVLKLIELFEQKNKFKLTKKKVILFDFYMRFPATTMEEISSENFDDKYSFYHWKPNYTLYSAVVNIILAKNFAVIVEKDKEICYEITELGKKALDGMKCAYMQQLSSTGQYVMVNLIKLSDSKIDEDIICKSNYLRIMGVLHDE